MDYLSAVISIILTVSFFPHDGTEGPARPANRAQPGALLSYVNSVIQVSELIKNYIKAHFYNKTLPAASWRLTKDVNGNDRNFDNEWSDPGYYAGYRMGARVGNTDDRRYFYNAIKSYILKLDEYEYFDSWVSGNSRIVHGFPSGADGGPEAFAGYVAELIEKAFWEQADIEKTFKENLEFDSDVGKILFLSLIHI